MRVKERVFCVRESLHSPASSAGAIEFVWLRKMVVVDVVDSGLSDWMVVGRSAIRVDVVGCRVVLDSDFSDCVPINEIDRINEIA